MGKAKVVKLLSITLIGLDMTACGTNSVPISPSAPSPAQTPPTTLTGNWLLTGSRVPAVDPTISAFLYVQGNIVAGQVAFDAQCSTPGFTSGIGSSDFAIDGTIDTNGAFQAGNVPVGSAPIGTISLSLTGNSPLSATPSMWNGTYSLVQTPGSSPSGASCTIAQNGTFTATPISSLTGTYIGTPVSTGLTPLSFGSGAGVSVQIAQGTPTLVMRGNQARYRIPLTANLTIDNSPCPVSASTTQGVLSGDSFQLPFVLGTPLGLLTGTLSNATADSFFGDLTGLATNAGCPGIAFYNFTRK